MSDSLFIATREHLGDVVQLGEFTALHRAQEVCNEDFLNEFTGREPDDDLTFTAYSRVTVGVDFQGFCSVVYFIVRGGEELTP